MSLLPGSQRSSAHATTAGLDRDAILAEAGQRARDGQFLEALDALRRAGSLRRWSGSDRTEVAWIARELGAPRLATWHALKAYREAPDALACRNGYAAEMFRGRGPLETLEFLEAGEPPPDQEPVVERLHWMWLHAIAQVTLRDFPAAAQWVERMEAVGERGDVAWGCRAIVLERQDRYEEAFEAIDRAIAIRAGRQTLQYKAHLLTLRGRDEEAYDLLRQADAQMQVSGFSWQMALIAYERRDYADAGRQLERFEALTPLRERAFADSFLLFRSELARRLGREEEAKHQAARSRSKRGREIAAMLDDPSRRDRVDTILPVPFIRQHEMTCGPATLAALSAYWGKPAEHLEVAEEICYAGTTNHAERRWAEENGFATVEFTVTESATEQLIQRGVPFTLVTRAPGQGHLQAVIGYDARTATVWLRDPYHRTRGAVGIADLLQDQAAHGPRGMAMVPREQADRLDGLDLPEARLYDLLHRFDGALIEHRRSDAVVVLDQLREADPEHRLTLMARRQLAVYDANELEMLPPVETLARRYPEDDSVQLMLASVLAALGRDRQRLGRLRQWARRPETHPLLILQYGEALATDGRTRDQAERWIRQAIRRGPTISRAYLELGDLWFARGKRRQALRMYRFAACLEETDEFTATRYFDAAVMTGQSAEVMRWLRQRFERFGGNSMQPAVTLATALLRQWRHRDALALLDEALQRRPDDSELKLFVAQTLAEASSEHWDRAAALLQEARGGAPQRLWRQTAARLSVLKGELVAARDQLRKLLPLSPMSMSLHEAISDWTSQIDGQDAAIAHWREAAAQFPHYQPLQERYAVALRDRPADAVQPVLEKIIEDNPDNAWAHRELAQHLLSAGRLDQAEAEIDAAERLDGEHLFVNVLRSTLAERRGQRQLARSLLRQAIERDPNDEFFLARSVALCDTADQIREHLDWVIERLRKTTITGDVLLAYRDHAEAVLPAEQLLSTLRDALSARGDLWPAHQAVIRQLTQMRRLEEAAAAADEATRRFPIEPAAWLERYRVAVAAGDREVQRAALKRVRLLRPAHALALRAAADLEASLGDYDSARQLLQQLVAQQPLDPVSRGYLGDCLWELDQPEAALEQFERAVRLDPEYEFAWWMIDRVAERLGKTRHRETVARDIAHSRPHETAAWLQWAAALAVRDEYHEAHACLDRAEALEPYREAVHIARGRLLAGAGDYEGALAALAPDIYPSVPTGLTLQRCQLMWDLGQQDEAYALARRVAHDDPTSTAAWRLLQQWAMLRQDREQAISAIEHQIAADPNDPDVLDNAGAALSDLEQPERAIETLRRAVKIAPHYTASRCRLFDLLIERGAWDEASRLVSNLARLDDHPAVVARRLRVAEHRGDVEAQEAAAGGVLGASPVNAWALDQVVQWSERQRRAGDLIQWLEAAIETNRRRARRLEDPGATGGDADAEKSAEDDPAPAEELHDALGLLSRHWAELRLPHGGTSRTELARLVAQIRRWLEDPCEPAREPARGALGILIGHLLARPSLADFEWFVRANQPWLRADTGCWATIAYAFAVSPTRFRKSRMRRWVAGYRERTGMEPWMLANVHEILRLTGQHAEAVAAVQLALSLPADTMRSQLALWAAHDCLVAGDRRGALRHFMQAARLEDLEGTDRLMHVWVESALMAGQAADRQAAFGEARRHLAAVQPPRSFFRDQPVYRPVYVRTLAEIARAIGTPHARLWAWSRRFLLFLLS